MGRTTLFVAFMSSYKSDSDPSTTKTNILPPFCTHVPTVNTSDDMSTTWKINIQAGRCRFSIGIESGIWGNIECGDDGQVPSILT